jgi:hypothetical protein
VHKLPVRGPRQLHHLALQAPNVARQLVDALQQARVCIKESALALAVSGAFSIELGKQRRLALLPVLNLPSRVRQSGLNVGECMLQHIHRGRAL